MKILSLRLFAFSLALALSTASAAQVDPKAWKALLGSDTRPTMQAVVDVMIKTHSEVPYTELVTPNLRGLPQIIAYMELLYPGAIWAPLGRDAVFFGDVLDAFYISIGQPGRVARLNGSGNTIRFSSEKKLVRFLKDAGLDFSPGARPFVMMDRTAYGLDSQSRHLMRAAYKAYAKTGGNPADLVRRVNFLALDGIDPDTTVLSPDAVAKYFDHVEVSDTVDQIHHIPAFKWIDTLPWHKTFGRLRETKARKLEGTPGARASIVERRYILGEMGAILKTVSTREFVSSVLVHASMLGYEFPIDSRFEIDVQELKRRREEELTSAAKRVEQRIIKSYDGVLEDLDRIFSRISPQDELRAGFPLTLYQSVNTQTVSVLSTWLRHNDQDKFKSVGIDVVTDFTSRITKAFNQNLLSMFEYRVLLGLAMSLTDANPRFLSLMHKICKENARIAQDLIDEEISFTAPWRMTPLFQGTNRRETYLRVRSEIFRYPVDEIQNRGRELALLNRLINEHIQNRVDELTALTPKLYDLMPQNLGIPAWILYRLNYEIYSRKNAARFSDWLSNTRNAYEHHLKTARIKSHEVAAGLFPSPMSFVGPYLAILKSALASHRLNRETYDKLADNALLTLEALDHHEADCEQVFKQ